MFRKILVSMKKLLILVIIQLPQNFMMVRCYKDERRKSDVGIEDLVGGKAKHIFLYGR